MADIRVKCCTKTARDHTRITHLGGDDWYEPVGEVIRRIEGRIDTFYTFEGGKRALVRVVGTKPNHWVQTEADGIMTNNLLDLPAC